MITNFENITCELNKLELELIPLLIAGFSTHEKTNPIKAHEIVKQMNVYLDKNGFKITMNEPRLRKCVNHIRSNSLLPLMATSDGYFVSTDTNDIRDQIMSLTQRANSIQSCADGLRKFINNSTV